MSKVNRISQRFIQATIGEYTDDPLGLLHVARLNYYRGFMLALELSKDKNYSGSDYERDLLDFHGTVRDGIKVMKDLQDKRVLELSQKKG